MGLYFVNGGMYSVNFIAIVVFFFWVRGFGFRERSCLEFGFCYSIGYYCLFLVIINGGKRIEEILKCYKRLLIFYGLVCFVNIFKKFLKNNFFRFFL